MESRSSFVVRTLTLWIRHLCRVGIKADEKQVLDDSLGRHFKLETLEPRVLLSADLIAGLNPAADTNPHLPGDTFAVNALVGNIGDQSAQAGVRIDLRASLDATLSNDDILIGSTTVQGLLPPQANTSVPITVTLPQSLQAGNYTLFAVVDPANQVIENNDSNNSSAAGNSITVDWQFGQVPSRAGNSTLSIVAADGTQASFSLTGGGQGSVGFVNGGFQINLTGATVLSDLHIQIQPGSGPATVAGIHADASLKSIQLDSVALKGIIQVDGALATLNLGDVVGPSTININGVGSKLDVHAGHIQDLSFTSNTPIGAFTAIDWLNTDGNSDTLSAPALASLTIAGSFQADLHLGSVGAGTMVLTTATISGTVSGNWNIQGRAGSLVLGASASDWSAAFTGPVTGLQVLRDASGLIATPSLLMLQVGGNLNQATFLIGANLGADGKLGGTGINADQFGQGVLAHLRVTGNIVDSQIRVGSNPIDGIFDNGNDVIVGDSKSLIQELLVGGKLLGITQIIAGAFPASVKINGQTLNPTAVSALRTRSKDNVAPILIAGLSNDSGLSSTDKLTNNPAISGSVSDLGGLASLKAGFDNSTLSNYVDISGQVGTNGAFTLDRAHLAALIPGGVLTDGPHMLHLLATDQAGNASTFDVNFILDSTLPQLTASLANDTGALHNDGVSTDPTVTGTLTDTSGQVKLLVALDPASANAALTDLSTLLASDGSYTINAAQLATLAGGALSNGPHTLRLVGEDAAGNRSAVSNVSFTLDTAAPVISSFQLDSASDTGVKGDGITELAAVTLSGQSEAGSRLVLRDSLNNQLGSTLADNAGNFSFNSIALSLGGNSFSLTATDAAGNSSQSTLALTRSNLVIVDATAPVLTAALANDTGASNTDGVTSNPTVQGKLTDDSGQVKLLVALDPASANATLTDLSTLLASDGSYTINAAQLATLAGGALNNGPHTLRLVGEDPTGNRSVVSNVSFTLDTAAPVISSFILDPASDSGVKGDGITELATVTLSGHSEAGSRLVLRDSQNNQLGSIVVDNTGNFSFNSIALSLGGNSFSLTATDLAGNSSQSTLALTRSNPVIVDTTAPVLTAALANDTGASNTDGVTSNPTVQGKLTDDSGQVKLLVALDPASANATLTDLSTLLASDGSYVIDAAQLAALAGGALSNGPHTLRLVGEDPTGNRSVVTNLNFTLDISAPAITSVGLSSSSDTGTLGDGVTAYSRVTLTGTATQGALVSVGDIKALAGAGGVFQLTDVALNAGDNLINLTITDLAGNTSQSQLHITRQGSVQTDVALTWNQLMLDAIRQDVSDPTIATRVMAMVSLAQYDTLAAIEGTPAYLIKHSLNGPTNTDVALAKAAQIVLDALFPARTDTFDTALAQLLAGVSDGAAKTNALALGQDIAQAVLAQRQHDGSDAYIEYNGSNDVGKWRSDGPMYLVAQDPQWGGVTPFALNSANEFLPAPPPSLDSAAYATAVNEIQSLGSVNSTTRSADQTQQAQFWSDGQGSYTPPGHWNLIAEQIAQAQGNSLAANVRLFAKLNVALADSAIAAWDAKYTYSAWRPVDAIQQANLDNNAATTADPNWTPLLITPPHPEYVSGHSTFSMAAATVLADSFGDNTAFTTTAYTLPGVSRSFTSFTQAADEAGRSRIYGGIHFEFSNQAGLTLGKEVGQAVLARFALTTDTQAPVVTSQTLAAAANSNQTLTGQILDNLSGVAGAQYRIDGGALQNLSLDSNGNFSITTGFAVDGAQDGSHSIAIVATDVAGNVSAEYSKSFILDTKAPTLSLTSLADGAVLKPGARLTGTADATGTALTLLNFRIDGGVVNSLVFDSSTGGYDQALDFGSLDVGNHTLLLTAQDAAGNTTTLSRTVTVDALALFNIVKVTPTDGTSDVGTTYRPQVYFSRAVKASTLTNDSFYATGPDGAKLSTTIVPAADGSFAWLFFNDPMPGGSQVTLHLIGSAIRAEQDGAFLDGDSNGVQGGDFSWSFTTVSTASVVGTSLVGKVVDPGADLLPMTFDDIRRGPDGVIHTADDVFLNPIVHAKVYILGRPDLVTYTDAQGNFSFDGVPVGDVKVGVDGRTATNPPTGVFWPEMVMNVNLKPGIVNTVMGSMGATAEQQANASRVEIYLPRVQSSAMQTVSDTAPTTITVDSKSAPDLTAEQRSQLTLTVNPGSAVGADGKVLTNVKIGINTVPPELVKDMLPVGVLQHTFDITIQAPGVDTFTQPVQITLPNVFNAAPGTKLNILSFDHTTGMLVIDGTGTVSADGLTVVSDPGSGVKAPGWHGLTPPGGCGGAGGPPPAPVPPDPTEQVTVHDPVALNFITGDTGASNFPTFTWTAPPVNPGAPNLPPIPGCDVPNHNPSTSQQPFINVTIQIDGALDAFAKPISGGLPIVGQAFTLSPGTGETKTFGFTAKTYDEMFGANGFASLLRDQLYGAKVTITVIEQKTNGDRTRDIYSYYEDRWVDVVDANMAQTKTGNTAAFFRTNTDGVVRDKNIDVFLPTSVQTSFNDGVSLGSPFDFGGSVSGSTTVKAAFDPYLSGARTDNFDVQVNDPSGALTLGTIVAKGTATNPTTISVDKSGYETELGRVVKALQSADNPGADGIVGTADDTTDVVYDYGGGLSNVTLAGLDGVMGTADDVHVLAETNPSKLAIAANPYKTEFAAFLPGMAYTQAQLNTFLDTEGQAMMDAVAADYTAAGSQYKVVSGNFLSDVQMSWLDLGKSLYGEAQYDTQGATDSYLKGFLALRPLVGTPTISESALEYALAESLNPTVSNTGKFAVAINIKWTSGATFAQFMANTVSHELAHTFGLNDAYLNPTNASVNPPNDIMRAGNNADGDLTFATQNVNLLEAALGLQANGDTPLTAELTMYRNNINLPGSAVGNRLENTSTFAPELGVQVSNQDILPSGKVDFGAVAADGTGGSSTTLSFILKNTGYGTLDLNSLSLAHGDRGFRIISTGLAGATLAQDATTTLTLAYDPNTADTQNDTLTIGSNGVGVPSFNIALTGRGITAGPSANVSINNNNLGGTTIGGVQLTGQNLITITSNGSQPLVISNIGLISGGASFTLNGVPSDLANHPITLNFGESLSFGASFVASQLGLNRGIVKIVTNSTVQQSIDVSLVGTGIQSVPQAHWGNDYVVVETTDANGNKQQFRTISDSSGNFMFFLPPGQDYHLVIFDPVTGLVAHGYGITPISGKGFDMTSSLVFRASTAPDHDFDGLPDDIEFAVGSNPAVKDTNKDGIDDFTSIQQGINPLGSLAVPTGVLSAVSLNGSAQAVAVLASPTDASVLTAYVATGTQGLAVVDVSKFTKPAILSTLDLTGNNLGIAVDATRGVAAIAAGDVGLHLVDVSDAGKPQLLQTIAFGVPVNAVQVRDGLAFVAVGTDLDVVNLLTGDILQTLALSNLGGSTVTSLAIDGSTLYSVDIAHILRSFTINGNQLATSGSLTLPAGGGKLFVGAGVAYIGAGNGGTGGYVTVDVSNPANLNLLSGVDLNSIGGTAVVPNGSGLAVAVGSSSFVFGSFKSLDVMNVSDPKNTANFITRYNLPAAPTDVVIANGLAFVADGTGGLQVVNYASFDTKGVAPTVSVSFSAVDADPVSPGVQVLEGRAITVTPTVADDVQVRNVELLVNGKVVANDASFPFQFTTQVPTIAQGGNQLVIQVRATDTGGNTTLSDPIVLHVVPDTFPPKLSTVNVDEGARRFFVKSVDFNFDEPLDTSKLTAAKVSLVKAGADGLFGTADDISIPVSIDFRALGQTVSVLPGGYLTPGDYQLTINGAAVSDQAGNALATDIVRHFSIRPASDVRAASGVADITTAPSANPGQEIAISVPFDPSTAKAQFSAIDANGAITSLTVTVRRWDATRGIAYFSVPLNAVTGDAVVYSQVGNTRTDFADGTFPLQIIPTITDVQVQSVAADGSSAVVVLTGSGFVEGNNSEYRFGSGATGVIVLDAGPTTGPDVQQVYNYTINQYLNGQVTLTVPLSDGAFGPISVKTAGGVSASFSVNLSGVTATALSGTPADATEASANAGQAITLTGSGLTTNTDVLLRYKDINGALQMISLNPSAAAADGSSATLIVPTYANGAYTLQVFGSTNQVLLQIVPTISSIDVQDRTVLFGSGYVEGGSSYSFAGVSVSDLPNDPSNTIDVYYSSNFAYQNGSTYLNRTALPTHGLGNVTVTTAGGTSAAFALNTVRVNVTGTNLGDVAVDPTNGQLWVSDYTNPGNLLAIDPSSGAVTKTITLDNNYGTPYLYNYSGLQFVTSAMSLGGTAVPAGSLLVFNGYTNPDRVIAVNTSTGAVIASLTLAGNYDLTAGVYDAASGHLFITENNGVGNRILELSAATGALLGAYTAPINIQTWAGLAIDPNTGHFWLGSSNGGAQLIELQRTGVGTFNEVRRLDTTSQGINQGEISGLSFAADGSLWVSSTQGEIYKINTTVDSVAVPTATLSQVVALADNGVAANAASASANVGQVIQLVGSNFGPGTRVLFNVRDNAGNTSVVSQTPLVINATGTVLQVLVPDTATTGNVRVVNEGSTNLGFSGNNDAVYRNVTLNFTAGSSNANIRFADGGLQGLSDESWGIDNVLVKQGNNTVFSDNFESGVAAGNWSDPTVNADAIATFSRFSGRFSNASQVLNLNGLTAGQAYTLSFDLLVLDSWDGSNTSTGPDLIDVSVDGVSKLHETLANYPDVNSAQSFRASAGIQLQIVPTLTSMDGGRPGEDTVFNLHGSGFMEGASTITIGGIALPDTATNLYPFDVTGARNDSINVVAPLTLDGPIRISTAGGYAQLPVNFGSQPVSVFTGISATAPTGAPADATKPSAVTGQTIVLQGQGFTSSTLVQFQGIDDNGTLGTVTRTGTVSNNGATLSIVVPVLARSGAVTVLGSNTSYQLQIVPTLTAVGGSIAAGNTLVLQGTGLTANDLVISIDGRTVGNFTVRTIVDGTGTTPDQQLLTLVVPNGVGAGQITVSTAGGSVRLRIGVSITSSADVNPAADVGDTLATAQAVTLATNHSLTINSAIGDVRGALDVDLYRVDLNSGDQLSLNVVNGNFYSYLRIFDATGQQLLLSPNYFSPGTGNTALHWSAPTTGSYYIGVSGYSNTTYNPTIVGSGSNASYSGNYALKIERSSEVYTGLTGISATAASGTAANTGIASANIGQSITLSGVGLLASDKLVFTTLDDSGNLSETTVTPASIDVAGQTLTVVVPTSATTGSVRLARLSAGLLLQIVPTLSDISLTSGASGYVGNNLQLTGSGFAEGASKVLLGSQTITDIDRYQGLDVFSSGTGINLTVPSGAATGPIRVSTVGGTSAAFGIGFTGLSAGAASGTAAGSIDAAANPGQTITLQGSGLDTSTDIIFQVIDQSGNRGTVNVRPSSINASATQVQVQVPLNAVTGLVSIVGSANTYNLQIVPTITDVQVQSVAADGSSAVVVLTGSGFVEGNNSEYRFGSGATGVIVLDAGPTTGPDVQQVYNYTINQYLNGQVTLTVPLSDGAFGPISVKTAGGVSASFSVNLSGVTATALSGTPADATEASANAGQAITLTGSGLTTNTDVLLRYKDINGALQMISLNPSAAAADGSSATLIVPTYANGAYTLQVFGSTNQVLLQIVPTISSIDVQDRTVLFGSGYVEGGSSYSFAGVSVSDLPNDPSNTIDVYYSSNFAYQNGSTYLNRTALPTHGLGNVTVTTAGGTSAAFALNTVRVNVTGTNLGDVAVDPTNGQLWVSDYTNPGNLLAIDPSSGAVTKTITLDNNYGTPYLYNYSGLQFVTSAMSLGGTAVPAGSLLVFNGYTNPDRVIAVNTSTGAVIASLTLAGNYDLTAGVYDAASGHLFITENNGVGNRILELSAATGALLGAYTAPINIQTWAGLAIDPNTGHFWLGSSNGGAQLIELQRTGVGTFNEVRRLDTTSQGINQGEISGLSFAADGSLWVSSTQGEIYKINTTVDSVAVPTATLSQVVALADNGVAANAASASANVGQVIQLVGSNFGPGTRVLFNVRDNAGNTSVVSQTPLVINATGTVLQVLVPDTATTGNVRVVNEGSTNLGFSGNNDAVYRNVTLNFTAGSSNANIRFADGGLQGLSDESWGIDNVLVKQGNNTVFSDNFESGVAAGNWSDPTVNADAIATFSRFSGRFSNASQVLNLNGLTAGQAYTLSFDLLVLDSWDGSNTSTGPDLIDVSVDGVSKLHETLANYPDVNSAQSFRASAGIQLQIVPTLTSMDGGRPGEDTVFNLHGSGFMEGASTITIGGIALPDTATNLYPFDVTGARNDSINVVAPLTLDGPIRISTAGGYAQLPVNFGSQPVSVFTGISATAPTGAPADATKPSAVTGQTIVLQGQGFTSSTLVQFQGIDDNGTLGTVTRTGTVSNNGATLSIVVPVLARSGAVTVLGSNTSYQLQIVPTLTAVGGSIAAGNTLVLQGTGLTANDLVISIDGRTVGNFTVRTIVDGTGTTPDQQLLTLVVPNGVGAGQITVSTAGGSVRLRIGVSITSSADVNPAADVGDTLATAQAVTLATNHSLTINSAIGDVRGALDVDLYRVDLNSGDQLSLNVVNGNFYSYLRIFDATGQQLLLSPNYFSPGTGNTALHWSAPTTGSYYIGVSGYSNTTYNPTIVGSGSNASYSGNYALKIERSSEVYTGLTGISATAASGTAANTGIASANIGQSITLSGVGLLASDKLVFTTLDDSGNLSETTVTPASIDVAGQTLTVVVPTSATTGSVRLARLSAGLLLQIVPTLSDISLTSGASGYVGNNLQLTGSGFAEGASKVLLGSQTITDIDRYQGLDVFSSGTGINLTVPSGAATGPIRVSTVGGTSAAFGIGFTGLSAGAASGTAAGSIDAAANPGQTITLQGSGLDTSTDIIFQVIDQSGNRGTVNVRPSSINASATQVQVQVPLNAVTGLVSIVGSANTYNLQIVPTITDVQVQSVAADGSSAVVVLTGSGFVEGNNSEYRFGSGATGVIVLDAGPTTGPDVQQVYNYTINQYLNGQVTLTVPLSDGAFGPISVKTAGGVSASFSVNLSGVTATALSGTPADATEASANAGQAITLTGSGLTTNTDVLLRYKDINGALQMISLNPSAAAADGSSATLIVPTYANGAYTLQVFGSTNQVLLQIVPTISSIDVQDRTVLFGSGYVEGGSSYSFAGVSVSDLPNDPSNTIDVYYSSNFAYQNGSTYLNRTALPTHGLGNVTVTTAGGTSAAFALNTVRVNVTGTNLGDVAVDPTNGQLWVSDYTNPGNLLAIDPSSGAVTKTITLDNNYGTPYLYNYSGLQFVTSAMSLGGTAVPAGSLLVFNGYTNPDRVIAVNTSTGAVIASLTLAGNYDLTAGVYDAASGHLFITENNGVGNRILELSAATGALLGAYTAPINIQTWAGLAIDPNTGHFWLGSSNGGAQLIELQRTGVGTFNEVRRLDTTSQGINQGEISGLSFAADGSLWVSSTQGEIYKVKIS